MNPYITEEQMDSLVEIIQKAEEYSTGEIRVHIDSTTVENNARAAFDVFKKLGMHKTKERNAVLFHVNFERKYLTIIGDKGIHEKVCQSFWDKIHDKMTTDFAKKNYYEALKNAILCTGKELKKYFPVRGGNAINELPNEITYS